MKKRKMIMCLSILFSCILITAGVLVYADQTNSVEYTTKGGTWEKVNDSTYTMDKNGDGKADITLVKNGDTWKYYFNVKDPDAQYYAYEENVPEGYEVESGGNRANPKIINRTAIKYAHTTNVDDKGTQNGGYGDSKNYNNVVQIDGAKSLKITITYQTESTSYDWICMWAGKQDSYSASNNYSSSICGKLGGSKNTTTYTVDGDTVTIGFRSDGSVSNYYGYYATVEGQGIENDTTIINKSTTDTPGGLTLEKQINGDAAESDKNFKFNILLSSDREPLQKYVTGSNTYGDVLFKDGKATVYLKAGEKINIKNLPPDMHYQITEENAEGYTTTWSVNGKTQTAEGTITAGNTDAIVCTSTKNATPPPQIKMTSFILTTVTVNGDEDDVFQYHVVLRGMEKEKEYTYLKGTDTVTYKTDKDGAADVAVSLKNGEHADFSNIPVNANYQILQETNDYIASFDIKNGIQDSQVHGENGEKQKTLVTAKETLTENETPTIQFTNTKMIEVTPEPEDTITASINNIWDDDNNSAGFRPKDITVYLLQGHVGEDDTDFNVIGTMTLNEKNEWKGILGGLPKKDVYGETYVYKFQNITIPGYTTTMQTKTEENTIATTVVNKADEIGHLKITKTVTGDDANTEKFFVFTIQVKRGETPVTGTYDLDSKAGTKSGTVLFDENGKTTISLKGGESAVIKNLPNGATFTISEKKYSSWISSLKNPYDGTIEKNKTATVNVTNTYESGRDLTVSKEVKGFMADRTKDFTFHLTLKGDKIPESVICVKNGEETSLPVKDGIVSFSLKHGENIVFKKIPVKTAYNVEETNGDGYRVIYQDPDGTITQNDISVKIVNEKNGVVPTNVNPMTATIAFGVIGTSIFIMIVIEKNVKKRKKK